MIGVSESRPRWPDSSNPPSGEPGAVQTLERTYPRRLSRRAGAFFPWLTFRRELRGSRGHRRSAAPSAGKAKSLRDWPGATKRPWGEEALLPWSLHGCSRNLHPDEWVIAWSLKLPREVLGWS